MERIYRSILSFSFCPPESLMFFNRSWYMYALQWKESAWLKTLVQLYKLLPIQQHKGLISITLTFFREGLPEKQNNFRINTCDNWSFFHFNCWIANKNTIIHNPIPKSNVCICSWVLPMKFLHTYNITHVFYISNLKENIVKYSRMFSANGLTKWDHCTHTILHLVVLSQCITYISPG